ncbi:MAG: uroporphyrinogen-III synthase [Ectobacillus sp.]
MGNGLKGKKIAIAGSRKTDEMCALIEKQGGVAVVRPLQGTVFLAEQEVEPGLKKFSRESADWAIFTTGIGVETLLDLAEKVGIRDEFLAAARQAKVASRGYKTYAALKKLDIQPTATDDDGTTRGLIRSLQFFNFSGQRVMVQLHGETAPALIQFLENNGAAVLQLLPYQHIPPESDTVETLCQELITNQLDAVCFTTAIQVRSLFDFAKKQGYLDDILRAFNEDILAAAVGKITAEALEEEGVKRIVSPKNERMGAMVVELSRYYETF